MTDVAALSTPQIHDINMISASQIDQLDQMDLVPPSSSPSTSASRLIVSSRRGVSFSPQPETKYFDADDSILPEDGLPPKSIRSYALSDPASPATAGRATPSRIETPMLFRSVLKRKVHNIRIARTVEEGTLNNREAARLLVTGRRPGLVARDSFQLAQMRKGADEVSLRAGKEGEVAMPASDDSVGSEEGERESSPIGSEEEEEQVEQDGALTTSSLVDIVLNGAEDLLTLEEAYKTLVLRLRQRVPLEEEICNDVSAHEMDISLRPIKDEAPAMVRALHRDMGRLLGKVPNSEYPSPDRSSSPFKALQPLHDSTPINRRQTPSPTPTPSESKELKPARQGYSEAEVRYRRESAGVGQAAIGMLGLIFERRPISSCFTEADMQSLLDVLLMVPRTPNMPTPNPKRTYFAATIVLSNMRIPSACVNPIREKIVKGIESMTSDTFGSGGVPIRDQNFKKEVYNAIAHLMTEYPSIFFAYYAELLAPSLRGVASQSLIIRQRATSAVTAFAAAKINIRKAARDKALEEKTTAACAEWVRLRHLVNKSEVFVANHLKRVPPLAGRTVYTVDGERRTEWLAIDKLIKEKMTTDVYWGCAVWASLVTLVGEQYASFGLANGSSGFNNIMAISSNTTRATLARLAWNHAIHAYLVAGSAQSIDSDHRLVQSYKPFATVGNQDSLDRLETILMPVTSATTAIHAPDSWSRSSGPSTRYQGQERCFWQRTEKGKKAMWLSTCGESAAGIVYAFVGTALSHRDQPAKEVSLISGLPSSDGIPIPETSIAAQSQDRLDRAWDQVMLPILRNLATVHGVDKLKLHGWSILEALTKSEKKYTETWDIDRLLCAGYLTGEALQEKLKDKEVGSMFVDDVERGAISPTDISPMGSAWIIRRLESVLNLFQLAIAGINGLSDLYGVEAIDLGQGVLFPVTLTAVWSAVLKSINDIRETEPAAYINGVRLVTRHLCQVFNGSPASYLPISLMSANEQWTVDLDSARILVFSHLFTLVHESLHCEGVSKTLLSATGDAVDTAMSERAFGTDSNGGYTMAGSLLSMLMSTTLFSGGLAVPARTALQRVVFRLINGTFVSDKLLGDMTNRLHSVYEDHEEIQLDFWRALASRWTKTVNTDRHTSGGTNHTGALLVSLLSNPFRGRHLQSVWHQDAGENELKIWSGLLEVVVARFRLKGVGPNLGVLESLAGHLGDFFIDSDRACTSTITLSCLTALASHMSCSQLSHHVDDHFSINENYVPLDFLTLVSDALTQSYPGTATLGELSKEDAVSSAVYTLLKTLREKFEILPTEFSLQAFEAVREGLQSWLSDLNKVVGHGDAPEVDQLYITLLSLFERSIDQGLLPKSASGFEKLLDIIAPRLSRAVSRAVPEAFQRLYTQFSHLSYMEFSDDARTFLEEVVAAAPGLIEVEDMTPLDETAGMDSLDRYPHAREAGSMSQAQSLSQAVVQINPDPIIPETQDEPMESLIPAVDVSTEYDADMSASLDKPEEATVMDERPAEGPIGTQSSPAASISGTDMSSQPEDISPDTVVANVFGLASTLAKRSPKTRQERKASPAAAIPGTDRSSQSGETSSDAVDADVFGPASSLAKPSPKKRERRKASRSSSARSSKSSRSRSSTAEPDVKPSVPIEVDDEAGDEIVAIHSARKVARNSSKALYELQPAPTRDAAAKAGFISSASKWMSRLPTLGGLFSPSRHAFDVSTNDEVEEDDEEEEPSPAASSRKRKTPHQLGRSYSQPELGATTRNAQAKRPVAAIKRDMPASRPSKRPRINHTQSNPGVVVGDSDSEDELLLSPESAKQRKAEEEMASRALAAAQAPLVTETQHSTGRFDDAPTPNPRAFPQNAKAGSSTIPQADASPIRTTSHARLLEMVQQAEQQKKLVESMTFDDLDAFNEMIDTLQQAGRGAMRTRMTALRKDKRKNGRK